jgi:hypothetical protein
LTYVGEKFIAVFEPPSHTLLNMFAKFCQNNTSARASEQRSTASFLKITDLSADVRLNGVSLQRNLREAAKLSNLDK